MRNLTRGCDWLVPIGLVRTYIRVFGVLRLAGLFVLVHSPGTGESGAPRRFASCSAAGQPAHSVCGRSSCPLSPNSPPGLRPLLPPVAPVRHRRLMTRSVGKMLFRAAPNTARRETHASNGRTRIQRVHWTGDQGCDIYVARAYTEVRHGLERSQDSEVQWSPWA